MKGLFGCPHAYVKQVGNGADIFLRERNRRLERVRICYVGGGEVSERGVQRPVVDLSEDGVPPDQSHVTPEQAFVWCQDDFVPGSLGFNAPSWENEILSVCDEEEGQKFLRWIGRVDTTEFVDPTAEGFFQGKRYKGSESTSVELPNHVPDQFHEFVDQQIGKYLKNRVIVPWDEVADTSIHPRPHIVMPSGVEESKPRHFVDGRWLNLMMARYPFKMDAVGKVGQIAWPRPFRRPWTTNPVFIMCRWQRSLGSTLVWRGAVDTTCSRRCVSGGTCHRTSIIRCQMWCRGISARRVFRC